MPTYVYECRACGHRFEKFQSMTARVMRKCPDCSEPRLERLIGAGAGIIFKGGGFYETDYRRKGSAGKDAGKGGDTKANEGGGTKAGEGGGTKTGEGGGTGSGKGKEGKTP